MTGHTTPGVVSSIVSSEALQADLQGDLQALQRQEEILQVQEERSPQGDGFVQNEDHEDDYEDRENHHDNHDDREESNEEHEENQPSHEGTNEMFDSYWPKPTETEAITITSQDSSQEGVYEVRYEDNGPDPEVNEPEVISDSDSEEEQDYPVDRFIPIQGYSEDENPEGHEEHPSVEIVEPEGLYAYEEEYENEDEVQEGNEEYDHPPAWPSLSGQPRRISSSSDEVICLDSD